VLNNTKTQSRPKLLLVVPAISQNHKVLKILKTFLSRPRLLPQDQDQDQDFIFLSSSRLETKTLVSRTTSLIFSHDLDETCHGRPQIWARGTCPPVEKVEKCYIKTPSPKSVWTASMRSA